jgi:hypothetical protein
VRNALRHRTLALVAVLISAAGIGGCGYFHPARPENPGKGIVIVPDQGSPDATLGTIKAAVEAKGLQGGDAAYRVCFADSTAPATPAFHAFFAPENQASWVSGGRALPSDWTLKNEATFYNIGTLSLVNLRPEIYQMTWEIENPPHDDFNANVAILHRHYEILAIGQSGDVAGTVAKGYADITLVPSSTGAWVIVLWQDRVDDDPALTMGQKRLESQTQ